MGNIWQKKRNLLCLLTTTSLLNACGGSGLESSSQVTLSTSSATSSSSHTLSSASILSRSSASAQSSLSSQYTGRLEWQKPLSPSLRQPLVGLESNLKLLEFVDMDNDGHDDAVAIRESGGRVELKYFHNNGASTSINTNPNQVTLTPSVIAEISEPRWLKVADMNNDGLTDILLPGVDGYHIYLQEADNLGTPRFAHHYQGIPANAQISLLAMPELADLNGDGFLDFIPLRKSNDNEPWLWLKNSATEKTAFDLESIVTLQGEIYRLFTCDINNDSHMDIIYRKRLGNYPLLLLNDGQASPTFQHATIEGLGQQAISLQACDDVNGDGLMDVIASHQDDYKLSWYEQTENPDPHIISVSQNSVEFQGNPITGTLAVQVRDMDGDGDLDIATGPYNLDRVNWLEFDGKEFIVTTAEYGFMPKQPTAGYKRAQLGVLSGSAHPKAILQNTTHFSHAPRSLYSWQQPASNTFLLLPGAQQSLALGVNSKANENVSYRLISVAGGLAQAQVQLNALTGEVSVTAPANAKAHVLVAAFWLEASTPLRSRRRYVEVRTYLDDSDADNDGIVNTDDALPLNPLEQADSDGDGIGNFADSDDDNDGYLDSEDAFPLDKNEALDTDNDDIGNNTDIDDDGDGTPDRLDGSPLGRASAQRPILLDSDQDGTADIDDNAPLDPTRFAVPRWQAGGPLVAPELDVFDQPPSEFTWLDTILQHPDYVDKSYRQEIISADMNGDGQREYLTLWKNIAQQYSLWLHRPAADTERQGLGALWPTPRLEHHLISGDLGVALGTEDAIDHILASDMNNDGKLDILVQTKSTTDYRRKLHWLQAKELQAKALQANALMHFEAQPVALLSDLPSLGTIWSEDLDGDGFTDLVALDKERLRIFTHQGLKAPEFTERTIISAQAGGQLDLGQLLFGDIDGNGLTDILSVAGQTGAGSPALTQLLPLNEEELALLNVDDASISTGLIAFLQHDAAFKGVQLLPVLPDEQQLTLVDFNRDGQLDILMAEFTLSNQFTIATHLKLFTNQGVNSQDTSVVPAPSFRVASLYDTDYQMSNLQIADIDSDGDLDILGRIAHSPRPANWLWLEQNNPFHSSQFSAHYIGTGSPYLLRELSLGLNDLDHNGISELIDEGDNIASQTLNYQLLTIAEGEALNVPLLASDADGDPLSYKIIGGPDAALALASIDAQNGQFSFEAAPVLSDTQDANGDGIYEFWVSVSDGISHSNLWLRIAVYENDGDKDDDDVADALDAFPLDSRLSADQDGDGIDDSRDEDQDNDGVMNNRDNAPLDAASTGGPVWPQYPALAGDALYTRAFYLFVAEGETATFNMQARDPDQNPLAYSMTGEDATIADLFTVDRHTGAITLNQAPNIDTPLDADTDNDYTLSLTASDGYSVSSITVIFRIYRDDGDADDDGTPDTNDAFPFNPAVVVDYDGDNIGDQLDPDDDNDGVDDVNDSAPFSADNQYAPFWLYPLKSTRFSAELSPNPAPALYEFAASGDINNDGHLDFVAVSSSDRLISWFLHNGTDKPSFTRYSQDHQVVLTQAVELVDHNDDGFLDVSLITYKGIWTFEASGQGGEGERFSLPSTFITDEKKVASAGCSSRSQASYGQRPKQLRDIKLELIQKKKTCPAIDLEGDGDLDFLLADGSWLENHTGVVFEHGFGRYIWQQVPEPIVPGAFTVGDFNNDGHIEWLAYQQEQWQVLTTAELITVARGSLYVSAEPAIDVETTPTYSITLGPDAHLFTVDNSGDIYFKVPASLGQNDANQDGLYEFWVSASDADSTIHRRLQVTVQ